MVFLQILCNIAIVKVFVCQKFQVKVLVSFHRHDFCLFEVGMLSSLISLVMSNVFLLCLN